MQDSKKALLYKTVKYILCSAIVLTPLVFSSVTNDAFIINKTSFFRSLLLMALSVGLIIFILENKVLIPVSDMNISVIVLFITAVISFSMSRYKLQGLLNITEYSYYLVFYFMILIFINREDIKKIAFILPAVSGIVSLYAIFQHYGFDFLNTFSSGNLKPVSTIGSTELMGFFIAVSLPFTLMAAITRNNRISVPAVFLFVIQSMAIYLSGSFIAIFAAAVSSLIMFVWGISLKEHRMRTARLLLLFIAAFLLYFNLPDTSKKYENRSEKMLEKVVYQGVNTMNVRYFLWRSAGSIFVEHLFEGTGGGVFGYLYMPFRDSEPYQLRGVWKHAVNAGSDLLQAGVDYGVVAFLTTVFIMTILLLRSFTSLNNRDMMNAALGSSVISFIFFSVMSFTSIDIRVMGIFLVSGVIIMSGKLKIRELKLSGMVLKPVMIFLIIAAVILQFSFIFRNWYASYLIRKAVIAFGMNDVKISSGYYERAIKLDPFNDEYIASYGKMLEENISLKNRGSDMKKIFSLYTKAVEINPLNPYHYADIGRLLRLSAQTSANNSLYRRSLESYSVSTRLDPYNTYLSGDLAAAFAMCGNSSAAERYFSDALKIYPENQSALINMGILYYSTGRFQKALDCFEFPFTDKIFSKKADGFKDLINLKLQSSSRLKTF